MTALPISFLLFVMSYKMFASHAHVYFLKKYQKLLRLLRISDMQTTKQAVAILTLISGNVKISEDAF